MGGKNRFDIRLDPPELGRIDVRLDVDQDGRVTSRLVVERSETLDLLRRDAPQLERALQDAGLKTADNSLQFSLRDQGFTDRDGQGRPSEVARLRVTDIDAPALQATTQSYGRLLGQAGGVDIRI
jgi:flagellar hook-length control protein FliK